MIKQIKKTKIVATIGPASSDVKLLEKMIKNGMNIARMNFSHGDFAEHAEKVSFVRDAAKNTKNTVAILQDLGGPKIRTGDLKDKTITLKKGAKITLTTDKILGDAEKMSVNYKKMPQDVEIGHRILINDGKQELRVKKIIKNEIHCTVVYGGIIAPRRGINLPDTLLSLSSFTTKDKKDLEFGIKHNVDFVALSFVQSARDVLALKKALQKAGSKAMVITKIETQNAIHDIDKILEATDGIMVARGDLAVEVGAEKVPMMQKCMVKKANILGKPVIVATQMLETMIDNPVPTRAEVSDVSNAILDGADAVMLSAETAMGDYPLEVVRTMSDVALETERRMSFSKRLHKEYANGVCGHSDEAVGRHAAKLATDICAKAIVAFTETGATARMVAKFRIEQPIYVISQKQGTLDQMSLTFDAHAIKKVLLRKGDEIIAISRNALLDKKLVKKGDKVVVISGSIFGKPGETNTLTVVTV